MTSVSSKLKNFGACVRPLRGPSAQAQSPGNRLRASPKSRQQTTEGGGWGERGEVPRAQHRVTQLQGVPIDVGSVREGEGQETRCESTGGCERKQGRPAGDIRGGGTRAQERRGCSRAAAGKESDELRSFSETCRKDWDWRIYIQNSSVLPRWATETHRQQFCRASIVDAISVRH